MNNSTLDRMIVLMLAIIPGQFLFIKFFEDVRPSTSYIIGVWVGVLAGHVMAAILRRAGRNRSF